MTSPRVVLFQARLPDDPMRAHEVACFIDQSHLPADAITPVNMAVDDFGPADLEGFDAAMVGGSGDFSVVVRGFAWHERLLHLMREIVDRGMPMFASCFGFQALVQAHGGELVRNLERAEVGTFDITLTSAGAADPLFGDLPRTFAAQLGHLDGATRLPDGMTHLAHSALHPFQALRVDGLPIVASQFHPELCRRTNLDRFLNYLRHYKDADDSIEEATARAQSRCRESPEASRLIGRFLEVEVGYVPSSQA